MEQLNIFIYLVFIIYAAATKGVEYCLAFV